jgi:WD40 repeat protein
MPAYDMKVSPDGRIAAVYVGRSARVLFDISPSDYVPDESLLPIRLIDLTTGNELGRLAWQTDYTSDVAFTPDGKRLASYHLNGDIYVWDLESRIPIQRITALIGLEGGGMEFLPDGKTLVAYGTVGGVGQFLLWDVQTGYITDIWRVPYESLGQLKLQGYPQDAWDYVYVAFDISPDGTLLATATPNGEVMLWDTTTLEQTLVQQEASEWGQIYIRSVTFSADSTTLVYFDRWSQQTHFWDVTSRTETTALSIGSRNFGLSPRNDALAWATPDELWLANVDQPSLVTKVLDFQGSLLPTGVVTFTPDGNRIVVGGFAQDSNKDNVIYVVTLD